MLYLSSGESTEIINLTLLLNFSIKLLKESMLSTVLLFVLSLVFDFLSV